MPQFKFAPRQWLIALAFGAIAGLAAPGIDQWYFAWFAFAPLFLLIYAKNSYFKQVMLAFTFGLAYNLVYLHWYLNLAPLDWLGFTGIFGYLLAILAWLIVATHQALTFLLFAAIVCRLPLSGSFMAKRGPKKVWLVPAIVVLPLAYVLIVNRLGNMPDLMGVPWTMLEYTQYKQPAILQAASVIGGIGICALIVSVNVTLASFIATFLGGGTKTFKRLAAENKETAFYHCLGMALIVVATYCLGWQQQGQINQRNIGATIDTTLVQGGINIDMQKTDHRFTIEDLGENYDKLLKDSHDSLVVLPEGALPTYLREQPGVMSWLKRKAADKHLDIIVGSMDRSAANRPYNAAYGITSSGLILPEVYHKRFLVPIGEYTPLLVNYLPEWIKRWTNTPAGGGFAAGKEPVLLDMNRGKIAPLICFESISPEVTAASCRAGGQLLVNISDLAWFHKSDCGQQMLAFAVLRAIENRRYFIFAANTGPSAIIDPTGKITYFLPQGEKSKAILNGKVGLNSQPTAFALWYR
ncbi:apolipoprotein N-acyltransferase [soil metagenome]